MRESTSWLKESLEEKIKFAQMNLLPKLALKLENALSTFENEERKLADRRNKRDYY